MVTPRIHPQSPKQGTAKRLAAVPWPWPSSPSVLQGSVGAAACAPSKFGNAQGKSFHICWSFYHFRRQHHVHKVRFLASEISRLFGDSGGLPCSRPDCIKLLKLIQGLVQVDYGSVSDMKEILFWNFHHARITFFCKQRHRDLKPCSANPTKTKITYSANNTGT